MAMERDGWSTTADSNTAVAGIDIGENCDPGNLNNADRAIMAALANHAEVTVASAGTTNILAANSEKVAISGTTTITSLGTGTNRIRFVRFTGALTLTYNATSLILPGAANITTVAGDTMIVVSDASSNCRVIHYQPVTGTPRGGDVSFSAHKNGTDQTIAAASTETKVTFGTEVFDIGSNYASSTWTPPAGRYRIGAFIFLSATNMSSGDALTIRIYKSGAAYASSTARAVSGASSTSIETLADANGTDTFECYVNLGGSAGKVIDGTSHLTRFFGHRL